ncbi:hypothetical protein [Escherichia coli]
MIVEHPFDLLAVFPAPAGINRVSAAAELCGDSVPRASGDKPALS